LPKGSLDSLPGRTAEPFLTVKASVMFLGGAGIHACMKRNESTGFSR
jgi:hypothetical protein